MLIPRKVKYRKQHHPDLSGRAKGGTRLNFGEYGIQAIEPAYVTNRQIEAARIAMTRHIRRGGKVWINIFPDRPMTKKPAETRMGFRQGLSRVVGRAGQARACDVRALGCGGAGGQGSPAPGDAQVAHEVQVREARGVGVMVRAMRGLPSSGVDKASSKREVEA